MSGRGLVPVALAIGFGILNGYVVWNPAFQQQEAEKIRKREAMASSDLGPEVIEILVPRGEAQRDPHTTQQSGSPSSRDPNVQVTNMEREKS